MQFTTSAFLWLFRTGYGQKFKYLTHFFMARKLP